MNWKPRSLGGLSLAALLGVTTAFVGVNLAGTSRRAAAQSQSCSALTVVGASAGQTQVKKSVSPPSTGATQNNWNTDFAINGGTAYRYYLAEITSHNNGQYDIQVNLKYSNGTSDQSFKESSYRLNRGQPLTIKAEPRASANPYQINLEVGGVAALGDSYSVAAYGCR